MTLESSTGMSSLLVFVSGLQSVLNKSSFGNSMHDSVPEVQISLNLGAGQVPEKCGRADTMLTNSLLTLLVGALNACGVGCLSRPGWPAREGVALRIS